MNQIKIIIKRSFILNSNNNLNKPPMRNQIRSNSKNKKINNNYINNKNNKLNNNNMINNILKFVNKIRFYKVI